MLKYSHHGLSLSNYPSKVPKPQLPPLLHHSQPATQWWLTLSKPFNFISPICSKVKILIMCRSRRKRRIVNKWQWTNMIKRAMRSSTEVRWTSPCSKTTPRSSSRSLRPKPRRATKMTSIVILCPREAPKSPSSGPSRISWLRVERRCYLSLKDAISKQNSTKWDVKLLVALQISAPST